MIRRPLTNPYLRAVLALQPYTFGHMTGSDRRELWGRLAIGPLMARDDACKPYYPREDMVKSYAWAIPSTRVIYALAKLSPIIEVGAGTGYWAWMLRQAGADVLATDKPEPEQIDATKRWTDVVSVDGVEAAAQHPDRTLFICWPTYDDAWSDRALAAYRGSRLIYIGEGHGGCTATDAFHDMLDAQWTEVADYDIPQWQGIHDRVRVYRRGV